MNFLAQYIIQNRCIIDRPWLHHHLDCDKILNLPQPQFLHIEGRIKIHLCGYCHLFSLYKCFPR